LTTDKQVYHEGETVIVTINSNEIEPTAAKAETYYIEIVDYKGNACTTHSRNIYETEGLCIDTNTTFYLDFKDEYDEDTAALIHEKKPTVVVIDFPAINKQSILWQTLMECKLTNIYKDKEIVLGYIFDCTEPKNA